MSGKVQNCKGEVKVSWHLYRGIQGRCLLIGELTGSHSAHTDTKLSIYICSRLDPADVINQADIISAKWNAKSRAAYTIDEAGLLWNNCIFYYNAQKTFKMIFKGHLPSLLIDVHFCIFRRKLAC